MFYSRSPPGGVEKRCGQEGELERCRVEHLGVDVLQQSPPGGVEKRCGQEGELERCRLEHLWGRCSTAGLLLVG